MRSIRTKITAMTSLAILVSILSFGILGVHFIRAESNRMSAQTLHLICENRKELMNEYLSSIRQSVSIIARYATDSLDSVALAEGGVLGAAGEGVAEIPGRDEEQRIATDLYFDKHLALIESVFQSIANHTQGISACYYRINPEITTVAKGFSYTKTGNSDFRAAKLTDLAAYDKSNVDRVGWYYIPLQQGRHSWISPHHGAAPDELVVSYVVPIYKAGTFIGVIGIDIRFDTLVTQIKQFSNFETGFFILTDENGRIYYHPAYETGTELEEISPQLATILVDMRADPASPQPIRYDKDGTKWQVTYTTLANNMKLGAAVKVSEINTYADRLTRAFIAAGALTLIVFTLFATLTAKRVTGPLKELTSAAKRLAAGDYNAALDCESDDEVGVLTRTFCSMRDRLKTNFDDLSHKAFMDDLTGVKSKHAYVEAMDILDRRIGERTVGDFALILFDLNNLKLINDTQGHEAGDRYIRGACHIICSAFKHSPVYRIGGDEFVAVLEGNDFLERCELLAAFEKEIDENRKNGGITIASGYARFDPALDKSTRTVIERADEKMYKRKRELKSE
ncbi:MAG: diguanylate cyclase [Clostridia bacterium]|nr:diguanylate cyclase [Clostridia bacterium]